MHAASRWADSSEGFGRTEFTMRTMRWAGIARMRDGKLGKEQGLDDLARPKYGRHNSSAGGLGPATHEVTGETRLFCFFEETGVMYGVVHDSGLRCQADRPRVRGDETRPSHRRFHLQRGWTRL